MREDHLRLCQEVLKLARAQKKALLSEKFEEAIELQQRRQGIIEKMQASGHLAAPDPHGVQVEAKGRRTPADFSSRVNRIVKIILAMDEEMKKILQKRLVSLGERLEAVQKLKKALCNPIVHRRAGGNLSISI